jgi:hypothetical protein
MDGVRDGVAGLGGATTGKPMELTVCPSSIKGVLSSAK